MNCLHSFRTENNLKSHEKICKGKDFYGIVKSCEKNNTLEFNQFMTSDKMPNNFYADIESSIKKIDGYANNLEHFLTTKQKYPFGYSLSTIWAFIWTHIKQTCFIKQKRL